MGGHVCLTHSSLPEQSHVFPLSRAVRLDSNNLEQGLLTLESVLTLLCGPGRSASRRIRLAEAESNPPICLLFAACPEHGGFACVLEKV